MCVGTRVAQRNRCFCWLVLIARIRITADLGALHRVRGSAKFVHQSYTAENGLGVRQRKRVAPFGATL